MPKTSHRYLSLLLLLASSCLFGQNKDIKFHHITVDDGLPSNTVNSVIRDSRGFMWIASENGVSRYDGYSFTNFRSNDNDSLSISSNITYSVFEDKKERLWLGSVNGLDLFNRTLDRFQSHYFKGIPVRTIYQDKGGNLWIGSDKGLYLFNEAKGTFYKPYADLFNRNNNQYNTIPSIVEDHAGNLWVGTSSGVYMHEKASNTVIQFQSDSKEGSLSNNNVRSIIEDKSHQLWIATYGGGINLYLPKTKSFKTFRKSRNDTNGLSNDLTNIIWENEDGNLWIGTDGNGLDILDVKTKAFQHVVHSPYNSKSLNNSVVRSINSDGRGGIWLGTYAGGINFFDQNTEAFFHYKVPTFNGNNSVTSFAEEKNGNLWIGTDGGGLCYFNRTTGQFSNIYHNNSKNSLSDNRVLSLLLDHDNNLWIGTYLGGLCKYNLTSKTFHNYQLHDRSGLSDNVIWALLEDKKHRIWAGTNTGLNIYNEANDKFDQLSGLNSNLSNDMIRSMFLDSRDRLWIGTQQGLNLLLAGEKSFRIFQLDHHNKNGLSNDWIRTISEDINGTLWIGTFEGLNAFDESSNTFKAIGETAGLPDNTVSGIIGDNRENIWVSTGRGLAWLDLKTGKIKSYHVNDGLQDNQFNINASFKTKKGEILFGGINGFSLFIPDVIKRTENNKFPPPLVLTSFKIFNKEIVPKAEGSVLSKAINETDRITLSYSQSVLTFEFAALNFIQSENNHYAYKLEGFEDEWNYIGDKRSATYTNLAPGHYKFRVKASNNDDVWNETGVSLAVTITPPFWQTWWFKCIIGIVCLALALITGVIIRNRVREKIKINKLIAELEMKALIAQMNPHFIFNCLTSIQELIMINKQDEAMHYLNQFSRLLRNVLQSSEKNFIVLEQEVTILELYLELEAMRFDKQFHYAIEIDNAVDTEEIVIPSFLLQPFIENALWHGLMHKKGERNLSVNFTLENDDLLVCTIQDNGIGREEASRIKKKSLKANQSLGLKIIRERIALMKKQNDAIDLQIIDETDGGGQAAGTTVVLKLPLVSMPIEKTTFQSYDRYTRVESHTNITLERLE